MRRGRKATPSVTYYMRSSEYGDIKIMFTYNGNRYTGGSTYISVGVEDFSRLRSDGSPKVEGDVHNPKMANGVPISDLLVYLRRYIVEKAEQRLLLGADIDRSYVKDLCGMATKAMYERLKTWSSNLEWNRCVNRALAKGGDALNEFIGMNLDTMFTSLGIRSDEKGE